VVKMVSSGGQMVSSERPIPDSATVAPGAPGGAVDQIGAISAAPAPRIRVPVRPKMAPSGHSIHGRNNHDASAVLIIRARSELM
jgi:hypothetical protein